MNITNGIKPITLLKSRAALQDSESYESMSNAIMLKLISQGEDAIKQGNVKTQANVFSDTEDILLKRLTQHIV